MCAAVSPLKPFIYVRAEFLEAVSAEPFTKSFHAAEDMTSLVNPVDVPTEDPVVDGSEIVDMHCLVFDDDDTSKFRRLPGRAFISKLVD